MRIAALFGRNGDVRAVGCAEAGHGPQRGLVGTTVWRGLFWAVCSICYVFV